MSEPLEISLDPRTIQMLHELEVVFRKLEVEFYIVGAFARDLQFLAKNPETFARKTDDIDLAVHISHLDKYDELMEALLATGSFTRDKNEIIKLYYRLGMEVDIIPFGEIENGHREVRLTKPRVFTLQMPGFTEAFPFIETVKFDTLVLHTCPVEGLVMLKLISWDDKPHRTHDLDDIDKIINAYFDWNADNVYETHNDIFDKYDNVEPAMWKPVISAHIIGRKIKPMLASSPELLDRILHILGKRENPRWEAIRNGLNEI